MSRALVIGGGPAGLMAAEVLAQAGVEVTVCDAKPSFGRKFLMAGKSGLNLTKDEHFSALISHYAGDIDALTPIVSDFDAAAVMRWAKGLEQEIFTGSSGRVFPRVMKASPLLRAWLERLDHLGVQRLTRHRWIGWDAEGAMFDTPEGRQRLAADVFVLALGGASWARLGSDGAWVPSLTDMGAQVAPFAPSNAGVSIKWSAHMKPHFGQAVKSVTWRAGEIASRGEATVSEHGLEGGGVYTLTPALRLREPLFVDLIPDVKAEQAEARLANKPDKLRLAHWLRNGLRLPPVKVSLFFEAFAGRIPSRETWVRSVKNVPLSYTGLQPMDAAISTAGGVAWINLTPDLMLKAQPGVFCAGEMIDWDAPTGGYLLTACFATGRRAGKGAMRYLADAA